MHARFECGLARFCWDQILPTLEYGTNVNPSPVLGSKLYADIFVLKRAGSNHLASTCSRHLTATEAIEKHLNLIGFPGPVVLTVSRCPILNPQLYSSGYAFAFVRHCSDRASPSSVGSNHVREPVKACSPEGAGTILSKPASTKTAISWGSLTNRASPYLPCPGTNAQT